MAEKMYTIGEVHTITGISKDTLRFYDKIGLFKPSHIDPSHLLEIPAGEYACCVVNAKNLKADFSVLNRWLENHQITPEFVVANEVGLQLFEYLDHEHPCEVRVLVGP